jgi:hypothetical protein
MSPLSWIIVSLKTMRFVGLVGNAFSFRKPHSKIAWVEVGAEGWPKLTAVVTIRITV